MKILLMEDDKFIATFIMRNLKDKGYAIDWTADGKEGLELARVNKGSYTVIVVDIILPEVNGLKIIEILRKEEDKTPILILSSRDKTEQKVEGLNIGGDDYLTKPFKISELLARIRALSRRNEVETEEVISIEGLTINPNAHEVRKEGNLVELTNLEFRLLYVLMKNKGQAVSRAGILDQVWDRRGEKMLSNSISVHIKNLRKKVFTGKQKDLLKTIRGIGYSIKPE
ncbi:response regulator [Candidatus Dojkabacteria bacterium]|nr:response regulator [Candidatus Dojkabacteria bacterium]